MPLAFDELDFHSDDLARLQQQVCDMKLPSEDELFIQLSGLKQVRSPSAIHGVEDGHCVVLVCLDR